MIKRCLEALASKFDYEAVHVDAGVFNPARIWKLYGTLACKGDNTADRPHRMSKILIAPTDPEVVPLGLLEKLADRPAQASPPQPSRNGAFSIVDFISRHGLDVEPPAPWSHGPALWALNVSPLCEHGGDGVFIAENHEGAITAKCQHNSCSWGWRELREHLEPGCYERNGQAESTSPAAKKNIAPPEPFPTDCLPAPVSDYVCAAAHAIGCDESFIALPMLTILASAIGNRCVIQLKESYKEPALIWAAIIGFSGTHKSPALNEAMQFLDRRQRDAFDEYRRQMVTYELDLAQYEQDKKASRKKGADGPGPPPIQPVCQHFTTSDCTIEALCEMLTKQYDGILFHSDELAGWLGGIAQYKQGKGSDLAHWLSIWGAQSVKVDRKGKPPVYVPRANVSLIGGIQPDIVRRSLSGEHLADGLSARLLLTMPEEKPLVWTDETIDLVLVHKVRGVIGRLLAMEPTTDEDEPDRPVPVSLCCTPEAMALFEAYYNRTSKEQLDLSSHLKAAWSKLRGYAARFALIIQLATWAADDAAAGHEVDEVSMANAIKLADWFAGEARRVYSLFDNSETDDQQTELIRLIERKGGSISPRELVQGCRRIENVAEAEAELHALAEANLGKWEVGPSKTKQSRRFKLSAASTSTNPPETAETS